MWVLFDPPLRYKDFHETIPGQILFSERGFFFGISNSAPFMFRSIYIANDCYKDS